MSNDRSVTRRRYLATGTAASLAGIAGCTGLLNSSDESESPGDSETSDGTESSEVSGYSGPLQVNEIERADDGGRTVRVAATVENTGDRARQADLVVELSHTEAEGSISRTRPLLLASGLERDVVLAFRPRFFGEDGTGRPEEGEFRFDARFENDQVYENYPGLATPSERSPIAGGSAWPGVAYDPGATAHNPGTEAPRSEPTSAWTAPAVEYAYGESGPVVVDGTVVAGRAVRALSVEGGEERWVHDGPARTTTLATGEDVVAFGTPEDFRAVEAGNGDVRWTVSSAGDIWQGTPAVADGRVYASHQQFRALDAASGEELWTADVGGSLAGPPPVADGVVVAGGEPLRAFDAEDGTVLWSLAGGGPIVDAAIAHDTVFALTESHLVALDLAEGRTRWFAPGPFFGGRIAVGNGSVYAQSDDGYRMVSIDAANGNVEWTSPDPDGVLGPPSVSDGVLVVNSEQGTLYGIDTETGEFLWSMDVPSGVPGSVAIADGVAYFNESNGPLRALTGD